MHNTLPLCERCRDVARSISSEDSTTAARKLEALLQEVSGASVAEHRLLLVMAEVLFAEVRRHGGGHHDTHAMLVKLQDAMNPLLPESERR